ncbi:helix-turn-helix domain-containing protein [Methylobacterium tarhaniae]|uniref:helix-turn-helix domain-containing protein n=1 Tax=Methylobacterium tarhaniae TaxID=1187852 RepID=UPI003D082071
MDALVGARVAAFSKAKGISQTELGQAIGVTFQQVQKYEKGTNRISGGALALIAARLEVPVTRLYGDPDAKGEDRIGQLLGAPGALELLDLYAAMPPERRHALLTVIRPAAGRPPGTGA